MEVIEFFQIIKPKTSRRFLLFMAAFVWTFAGSMLLIKGFNFISYIKNLPVLKIIISIAGGILFYLLMFSKISLKHTKRIMNMENERPCMFSFFNIKSYFLMATMITFGIMLRKFEIISPEYISVVYITMGIPLSLSSIRFYYYGIFYKKRLDITNQEI